MLVLSRRMSQAIVIGHETVVTVLAIKGKTVRLGIDAPAEIDVHREEVQKRIDFEAPPSKPSQTTAWAQSSAGSN